MPTVAQGAKVGRSAKPRASDGKPAVPLAVTVTLCLGVHRRRLSCDERWPVTCTVP
jgi:hypothetical protein